MKLDFHTHGKLAKYLPFSTEYTQWLLREARLAGLDAICLTEHFNTKCFDEVYAWIHDNCEQQGDCFIFEGLKIFPGMETDIKECGHILSIGPLEAIRELNRFLEPHKSKESFLPFDELIDLFDDYPVLAGAAHPYREGGKIPSLPKKSLRRLDFIDMNGKDIAEDRDRTLSLTQDFGRRLGIPVIAGSDTHQAVQYGTVVTEFASSFSTFDELETEMKRGRYTIKVHPDAAFKVRTATLLKRSLKEIDALGGDYVSILIGKYQGESPAVLRAKEASA